jgi:hypothetical protein
VNKTPVEVRERIRDLNRLRPVVLTSAILEKIPRDVAEQIAVNLRERDIWDRCFESKTRERWDLERDRLAYEREVLVAGGSAAIEDMLKREGNAMLEREKARRR